MPRRGNVLEFSRRSRTRLQQALCSIPVAHVGSGMLFITLTYPREYPGTWQIWKAQLDNLVARGKRKFPRFGGAWKLEPQKRGAPHFHVLVVGVPFIAKAWLSEAWYEVVGSRDPRHLRAGTQVALARSHRGVVSYASKYTAKRDELPASWQGGVGRFWGMFGRRNLGIVWRWAPLTERQYYAATRIVRHVIASRARQCARPPPRPSPAGMWAVLPDWQALRIAVCARGTEGTLPPAERRERTYARTEYVGYRWQYRLGGSLVRVSAGVALPEPSPAVP